MESDTLHEAADAIDALFEAALSPNGRDVSAEEARRYLEIADELRKSKEQYTLPEKGDILLDPESDPRYGSGRVKVMETLDKPSFLHYVDVDTGRRSVAYMNPTHPDDAPVVRATYVDGSDKVYSFPVTRLE